MLEPRFQPGSPLALLRPPGRLDARSPPSAVRSDRGRAPGEHGPGQVMRERGDGAREPPRVLRRDRSGNSRRITNWARCAREGEPAGGRGHSQASARAAQPFSLTTGRACASRGSRGGRCSCVRSRWIAHAEALTNLDSRCSRERSARRSRLPPGGAARRTCRGLPQRGTPQDRGDLEERPRFAQALAGGRIFEAS